MNKVEYTQKMKCYFLIFCVGLLLPFRVWGGSCEEWFKKAKLKPGKDCLAKCVSTPVGMGTFSCVGTCEELCQSSTVTQTIHNLAMYPGLTKKERALIAENPKDALKVFKAKTQAERTTSRIFKRNLENDESDAFRHFMWAGLLRWEIGLEKTRLFTEAHEISDNNPPADKAMDLANNRAGILAAEELEKNGQKTQKILGERALEELRHDRLIVLEKKGMPK